MKVVINGCYGGFGISKAARMKLTECGHCERLTPAKYYGKTADRAERMARDRADTSSYAPIFKGNTLILDKHQEHRSCPTLVAVVEEMGEAANGDYARLRVVEIPDGVEFEIDEYNGVESIHEKHRSWS